MLEVVESDVNGTVAYLVREKRRKLRNLEVSENRNLDEYVDGYLTEKELDLRLYLIEQDRKRLIQELKSLE